MRRPVLVLALAVMLGARPVTVCAQAGGQLASKREAETKLQEGVILLKARRYSEALARFKEGYALVPSPLILYDFGLAQLGLGDDPAALQSFEEFLGSATEAPEGKRRKASEYRDDLRKRVGLVTVNADVPAGSIRLDGREVGPVEFPRRFYLAPGSHEFVGRAGNLTRTMAVTCAAGDAQTISLALSQHPAEPPVQTVVVPLESHAPARQALPSLAAGVVVRPSPASDARQSPAPEARDHQAPWWALAVAGAGAASIGAGLTFGLLASNHAGDVTADSQNRGAFVPADETSGLHDQRLEIAFLSIGAVAVLAGLGIYALIRHRETAGASQGTP